MSRKYQGLIVLNTKSLDGTVDDLVASVSKEFEAEGAKLDKIAQLGRRQFAYNARHLESGHYVNYTFQGSPEVITKIQSRLRLNGHVHLQHFVRVA
jgi:small subunit ribosomal protein S6